VKEQPEQYRNRSLTLKEVAPLFHDNLTSNNAKINLDRTKIQEKELYNRGMGEYLSRNLKLPQL
jgi:predicted nucleotide-binding protein (sugar kinase/HSP70/actin superfamily)